MNDVKLSFIMRLKALRDEREITQAELARNIDIGSSTVGMWETGERFPSAQYLDKVASYFNVTTDYLLGRTDLKQGIALEGVYFRIASEAQEAGVPPEDIEKIIELYKKYKR